MNRTHAQFKASIQTIYDRYQDCNQEFPHMSLWRGLLLITDLNEKYGKINYPYVDIDPTTRKIFFWWENSKLENMLIIFHDDWTLTIMVNVGTVDDMQIIQKRIYPDVFIRVFSNYIEQLEIANET